MRHVYTFLRKVGDGQFWPVLGFFGRHHDGEVRGMRAVICTWRREV